MYVSIIMPTYNKANRLNLTLLSLCEQTYPDKLFEVIIIDDGSIDETNKVVMQMILKNQYNIKYFYQSNKGRSSARNMGIKMSKGELLIFLDDDRIVRKDYIEKHVNCFLDKKSDNFVILGKRMNVYMSKFDDDFIKIKKEFLLDRSLIIKNAREEYYWKKVKKAKSYDEIKWVLFTTGNTSVKKKYLEKVGMFNEKFIGWGMEDTELGYKLWESGIDMIIDEEVINYHIEHKRDVISILEEERKNHELFYKLHPDKPVELFIKFIFGEISLERFNNIISGSQQNSIPEETFYLKHKEDYSYYE